MLVDVTVEYPLTILTHRENDDIRGSLMKNRDSIDINPSRDNSLLVTEAIAKVTPIECEHLLSVAVTDEILRSELKTEVINTKTPTVMHSCSITVNPVSPIRVSWGSVDEDSLQHTGGGTVQID
jgi:hypothetical protein